MFQKDPQRTLSRNIGTMDRLIRLVIGVMVLGLYGALLPPWKYVTLIGLIPLGTALTGYCPLYSILRVSTRRVSSHPA